MSAQGLGIHSSLRIAQYFAPPTLCGGQRDSGMDSMATAKLSSCGVPLLDPTLGSCLLWHLKHFWIPTRTLYHLHPPAPTCTCYPPLTRGALLALVPDSPAPVPSMSASEREEDERFGRFGLESWTSGSKRPGSLCHYQRLLHPDIAPLCLQPHPCCHSSSSAEDIPCSSLSP